MTDRFALPNGNNGACDERYGRYCGGNWRGIINKLDYIQGMGFDAIWISPVNENIEGSFRWGQPYHVRPPVLDALPLLSKGKDKVVKKGARESEIRANEMDRATTASTGVRSTVTLVPLPT